jgi:membrane protein DedA with SNARE-associated domain
METVANLLLQHGYLILFAWVLLDQLGLPIPAEPMVLAAGALAGAGHLNLGVCVVIVVIACLPPNLFWYWLGIHHGNKVLTLLCLIELETDACVNRTTSAFHRYGTVALLFAKFVPGLQTIASPMAGLLGVTPRRFITLSTAGSFIYGVALLFPA